MNVAKKSASNIHQFLWRGSIFLGPFGYCLKLNGAVLNFLVHQSEVSEHVQTNKYFCIRYFASVKVSIDCKYFQSCICSCGLCLLLYFKLYDLCTYKINDIIIKLVP